MLHYLLTPEQFCALYPELRDPEQIELPCGGGAMHVGHHPLYGEAALIMDGERHGLVLKNVSPYGLDAPGRRLSPMLAGDVAWAHLAALAGMIAVDPAGARKVDHAPVTPQCASL